jgi:hypothetical protein
VSWYSIIYGLYVRVNLPISGVPEVPAIANREIDIDLNWG